VQGVECRNQDDEEGEASMEVASVSIKRCSNTEEKRKTAVLEATPGPRTPKIYRGASLIRTCSPVGPYSRPMLRAL
jgi:hypothetical protein